MLNLIQRPSFNTPSSGLPVLRLGRDVKPKAAEDRLQLRMQKSKVLISSRASDTQTRKADYSDKPTILRGGGKMEMSVLFIIIKIWLFLCSHLSSPHAPIPPPECWWSQRLKSTICSIIFNYAAFTVSIIPPSSVVNRNHMLIDSEGQLACTVITDDCCHTDMLQVPSTEERSSTPDLLLTKTQNSQSLWLVESLRDYTIIPLKVFAQSFQSWDVNFYFRSVPYLSCL